MNEFSSIKRACGFYVSNIHMATKMLPFVNKKLEEDFSIITFLQNNINENINSVLDKTIINEKIKRNILGVEWKDTSIYENSTIEKKLKILIKNNKNIILVSGSRKYINIINEKINIFCEKNKNKMINKNILIINYFDTSDFNDNIREILDNNELILNTSGLKRIDEVFVGYEKRPANY